MPTRLFKPSFTVHTVHHSLADITQETTRTIPEEVPVELCYNGTTYATMMITPEHVEDFAIGFSLSETIVESVDDLKDIQVSTVQVGDVDEGIHVDIGLNGADYAALLRRGQRILPGRSGCGICGTRTIEQTLKPVRKRPPSSLISAQAIATGLEQLEVGQTLHAQTRAVHGAAFCNQKGQLQCVREDVGRHNALDKLIGAMARDTRQWDPADGFCLITSRCSYEMVQKAAYGGFSTLVAASAPTALALRTAQQAGLTVIALARRDGHYLFPELDREQSAGNQ